MDIRNILSFSWMYDFFQNIVGENKFIRVITEEYIRAVSGQRIMDIGCGTANVLKYLPQGVEYFGFDMHKKYIQAANSNYGSRGKFFCCDITDADNLGIGKFDIIIALGVIHHLDDDSAKKLFALVKKYMNPGGRFISVDGCFTDSDSAFVHFILKNDRGCFIRTRDEYCHLAGELFKISNAELRKDLLNIPYNSFVMELVQPD